MGFPGVNSVSGSVVVDGGQFSVGPMTTTQRAGSNKAMEQEAAFLKALQEVTRWKVTGNQLVLSNAKGNVDLLFEGEMPSR